MRGLYPRGPRSTDGASFQPPARFGDLAFGVRARAPALDLDVAPVLELLVDREELLDLLAQQQRQVLELFVMVPVGVLQRDADHLVVDALLVAHAEHADRLD